eukprot:4479041-Amphidinium_carterae.1
MHPVFRTLIAWDLGNLWDQGGERIDFERLVERSVTVQALRLFWHARGMGKWLLWCMVVFLMYDPACQSVWLRLIGSFCDVYVSGVMILLHGSRVFDATKGYPGEGPPWQVCKLCGSEGHNKRTCLRASPYTGQHSGSGRDEMGGSALQHPGGGRQPLAGELVCSGTQAADVGLQPLESGMVVPMTGGGHQPLVGELVSSGTQAADVGHQPLESGSVVPMTCDGLQPSEDEAGCGASGDRIEQLHEPIGTTPCHDVLMQPTPSPTPLLRYA